MTAWRDTRLTIMSNIDHALRKLRHLYEQMLVPGRVVDTKSAALGLLGPAIEEIEDEQRMRIHKSPSYLDELITALEAKPDPIGFDPNPVLSAEFVAAISSSDD